MSRHAMSRVLSLKLMTAEEGLGFLSELEGVANSRVRFLLDDEAAESMAIAADFYYYYL